MGGRAGASKSVPNKLFNFQALLLPDFDPHLPSELHIDASAMGYGAILLQKLCDNVRVIVYYSKRTTESESE